MPLIRAALLSEPDWLFSQAVVAGWNPELSDSQLFRQFAPDGFLSPQFDGRFAGDTTPAASPAVQPRPPRPADHCRLPREEISAAGFAKTGRQCFPGEPTTFVHNWITQTECVVLTVIRDAGSSRRCANLPGPLPQVHSERIPGITTQEIE